MEEEIEELMEIKKEKFFDKKWYILFNYGLITGFIIIILVKLITGELKWK